MRVSLGKARGEAGLSHPPLLRGEAVQVGAPATGRVYLWLVCFFALLVLFLGLSSPLQGPSVGPILLFLLSFHLYFHCYAFLDPLNFRFLFDLRLSGLKLPIQRVTA